MHQVTLLYCWNNADVRMSVPFLACCSFDLRTVDRVSIGSQTSSVTVMLAGRTAVIIRRAGGMGDPRICTTDPRRQGTFAASCTSGQNAWRRGWSALSQHRNCDMLARDLLLEAPHPRQ